VTPDEEWPDRFGWCLGELYKLEETSRSVVWRRYLVNNRAPVRVLVADSGRYVVTMDEWHEVGSLPIVIYNFRGELVKAHYLESLFKGKRVPGRRTVSSKWWSEDSLSFFGPDDKVFFIRLFTGQTLMLWLRDGDVMDEDWFAVAQHISITKQDWDSLPAYGTKRSAELAMEHMKSNDSETRKTGVIVAGQLRLRDSAPTLRSLLSDNDYCLTNLHGGLWMYRDYYVRRAAKNALQLLGEETGEVVVEKACAFPWGD
jgi:hypothetical protein